MVAPAWGTCVLVQDGSPAYWASLWKAREGPMYSYPPCKGMGWDLHSPVYSCPICQNLVTWPHLLQGKLENVVLIWKVMGTAKI